MTYGRFYLERSDPEGCEAGCDGCEEFTPGYLALRVETPGQTGSSFEVAKVHGGGSAEDALRHLLALANQEVPNASE